MPSEKLPFVNDQQSGLEEIGGASPVAMNVILEQSGTVRKRPGLTSWASYTVNSQGISGLYETVGGTVLAVAGAVPQRSVYRVTKTGVVSLSGVPLADIRGKARPTFAETEALVVIAGGAEPQKVVLDGLTSSRLGGGPPNATHVVANSSRLLLNDVATLKGAVYYSAEAAGTTYTGHEQWNGVDLSDSGFYSAESRPDGIVAIADTVNEVFSFGQTTTQTRSPDPTSVYAPVVTCPVGCLAPYSIVPLEGDFGWLDHRRRFVVSDAREVKVISDPIQRTLDTISTVSDCFGYRARLGGFDLVVWTFPTDGRTFVYQKGSGWSEWSGWDRTWTAFPVTAKVDLRQEGGILAGLSDGTLAKLELGAGDMGSPIRAYIETGFLNRSTDALKVCRAVRVALRRGESTTEGRATLTWRDELGPWEEPLELGFGTPADQEIVVSFRGLGSYRRRQWRFEFSGDSDISLVSAVEDFEVQEA